MESALVFILLFSFYYFIGLFMNKDEALKMAIEELSKEEGWMDNVEATINACKEALEQPAQEPVAIVYSMQDGYVGQMVVKDIPHKTKLYTHPHQWQKLTDDEIDIALDKVIANTPLVSFEGWDYMDFARAIEQALKEKNT